MNNTIAVTRIPQEFLDLFNSFNYELMETHPYKEYQVMHILKMELANLPMNNEGVNGNRIFADDMWVEVRNILNTVAFDKIPAKVMQFVYDKMIEFKAMIPIKKKIKLMFTQEQLTIISGLVILVTMLLKISSRLKNAEMKYIRLTKWAITNIKQIRRDLNYIESKIK